MFYFLVMNGKKVKQIVFIMVSILFGLAIIYSERNSVAVFSKPEPRAIYQVNTEKKIIALTFDISWGEKRAIPILNILKEKDIHQATFFLSSPWAKTHPEIVGQIKVDGHEIGSHGHKHSNYSAFDDTEIRKQILQSHQILTEITGKEPRLLRLPNGDFDKRVLQIATQLGYTVVQWDTDSHDWMNKGVSEIINRVVSNAHPGDIILMHASDSCKQTHEALPDIIDQLKAKGYTFVTVSELLSEVNSTQEQVTDEQK
jgi:polysaccharide deacetylase family sporulation protein PdaB